MKRARVCLVLPGVCSALCALLASCTLGSLTDYEVETCRPAPPGGSWEQDTCSRLSGDGVDACHAYRCDSTIGRCVLGPRDDDRDGQAPIECGGEDCDDQSPTVGGNFPEMCADGGPFVDEDCDGVVDENVGFSAERETPASNVSDVRIDAVQGEIHAAFVQREADAGSCIQMFDARGGAGAPCPFGEEDRARGLSPRQPSVVRVGGSAVGVAYVETSAGCSGGLLAYRMFDGSGASVRTALACGGGVALPSLAAGADDGSAFVAYFDAPLETRNDPFDDCSEASPAPLRVAQVRSADGSSATLSRPWPRAITENSASVRPPALLRVRGRLLLAAPSDESAAVWKLDEVLSVADPGTRIPEFDGARSVAMGADDETGELAFVAQVGCDSQSLRFALASWREDGKGLVFRASWALASGALAADPKVTRLAERGEWLVTWLDKGPTIRALRIDGAGAAIGAPFTLLDGAQAVVVAADGSMLGFRATRDSGAFVQGAFGCAEP